MNTCLLLLPGVSWSGPLKCFQSLLSCLCGSSSSFLGNRERPADPRNATLLVDLETHVVKPERCTSQAIYILAT